MLERGLARASSLSWFQDFEDDTDDERNDAFEGRRKYFPVDGVTITKQGGAAPFRIPDGSFQSAARERDRIFIFSTSTEGSQALAARLRRPCHVELACVKIRDPIAFAMRFETSLKKRSPVQQRTFFGNCVSYYSFDDDPNPMWALPHRLVMHKHKRFAHQREYRLAFGLDKHVFKPYGVETIIQEGDLRPIRPTLNPVQHCGDLVLGPLTDVCELVRIRDLPQ